LGHAVCFLLFMMSRVAQISKKSRKIYACGLFWVLWYIGVRKYLWFCLRLQIHFAQAPWNIQRKFLKIQRKNLESGYFSFWHHRQTAPAFPFTNKYKKSWPASDCSLFASMERQASSTSVPFCKQVKKRWPASDCSVLQAWNGRQTAPAFPFAKMERHTLSKFAEGTDICGVYWVDLSWSRLSMEEYWCFYFQPLPC